ncbi:bel12-ag transposon polyprotein [Lasius niger]|uniref:Bel12-ag transposon polyprotein n=1 Tax=Lasius niger TaxID=67767 RepID=A0A0J7JUZ1_LASNI|nr:bel12-ag transposon polyprotein [Lasius niger]
MYRQVLLNETQIPLQRILWRDQATKEIKTYELVTLTYGTAPASFLATKVIQQLAKMEEDQFPMGRKEERR